MNEIENIEMCGSECESTLFDDVSFIIENAQGRIATFVNSEICLTNWYVGKRIKEDVLYNRRADYGKQVLNSLSIRLVNRFGKGWGVEKLKQCVRSAYIFSEDEIMYAARTQLSWTHLRSFIGGKHGKGKRQ